MSSLISNATIKVRRDTASNWTSNDTTLNQGEWGYVTDTKDYKIGDGSTAWNSLPFSNPHPIGSQYIQYAVSASNDAAVSLPTSEAPTALFGGTWEKLWETESVFFRTEGTLADTDRTAGLQEDQFQGFVVDIAGNIEAASGAAIRGLRPATSTDDVQSIGISTDGVNGTPRTGAYTHPKNRLMRIWRRTA